MTDLTSDGDRQRGDPEADAVVAELGPRVWAVNAMLRHVHGNDEPLPAALPRCVRELFERHVSVPEWYDPARGQRAQRWASAHLFHVTVALFCASLPTSYSGARGVRVLARTGRMEGAGLDRRVNETARFLLDVLAEGAMGPSGHALRAIQKVRLVHAAVRQSLRASPDFADEVPINQEDLLGTLMTFSVVVTRAVTRLGSAVGEGEVEDYFHLWRAVGAMLGIEERLLPVDHASALVSGEHVSARQLASSEDGRRLMASLLEAMEDHVPRARFLPRWLVRHLVGDRVADALAVPRAAMVQDVMTVARFLPLPFASSARGLGSLVTRAAPLLGRPLLETVVATKLRGRPATFAMPE